MEKTNRPMVVVMALIILFLLFFWFSKRPAAVPPVSPGGVACTMEAKICPDGTAVGRSGPNCEFGPCP